jgi:hypothetical protein
MDHGSREALDCLPWTVSVEDPLLGASNTAAGASRRIV